MNKTLFQTKNLFLGLRIIGIVLFVVVMLNVDVNSVWRQMRTVSQGYFALALVFQLLLLLAKGFRWHLLIHDPASARPVWQSIGEFLESYAIGVITPGRLGELVKVGYQEGRERKFRSGISILIERGLDFGFFILIAGVALGFGNMALQSRLYGVLVVFAGILSVIVAIGIGSSPAINQLLVKWFPKYFSSGRLLSQHIIAFVLMLSVLTNFLYFSSCYFLSLGLSLPAGYITLSGGVSLSGLLNTIPLTIMGIGTRDVAFLYVFKAFDQAAIIALSGLILIVAQIGGGIIALLLGQIILLSTKNKNQNERNCDSNRS